MKVLIIDRDRDNCEHMTRILVETGAQVIVEPIQSKAAELIRAGDIDVTFFDPNPQNETRAFIIGVRRSTGKFPPIVIMTHQMTDQEVFLAGGNDRAQKPIDRNEVIKKARNAHRISSVSRVMADESEDFPSKDGIIAKSAFNQLYITCLDRADRHGERSYLIFVSVDNLDEITANDGEEASQQVADALRKNISRTRRTSDIAGHITKAQFCLLLLRPGREDEPFLAASRFAENLKENHDIISTSPTKAILKVWLLAIPTGDIPVEHFVGRD